MKLDTCVGNSVTASAQCVIHSLLFLSTVDNQTCRLINADERFFDPEL